MKTRLFRRCSQSGSLCRLGSVVCTTALSIMAMLTPLRCMAQSSFQFGVVGHAFSNTADDTVLRRTLADSDEENLAFLVVNGIKASGEPCIDSLYQERRDLLQTAQHGVVVALAASDWVNCHNQSGNVAIERLSRLREILFTDEFSLGATRIPLLRQSLMPQFRAYAWQGLAGTWREPEKRGLHQWHHLASQSGKSGGCFGLGQVKSRQSQCYVIFTDRQWQSRKVNQSP